MDYIMVTFRSADIDVDLKVPIFVRIEELLVMLSEALNVEVGHKSMLQAEPLGRILDNGRTLEQEEVTNGSVLTLI